MVKMFIRTEKSVKEFMMFYPIVSTLVIINLALWIVTFFPFGDTLYNWGIGHNYSIYERGEYWRFFTPIFLHGSLTHVLFNSFALVLFGPALEQMLGKFKFILAYLGAGLAGNLGTYIINPADIMTVHLGASGAIYGLYGIYIFIVLFRKHLIDAANAQVVTTIFIIGLIMTFINPGINIYAHIFGFIGGFAIAPLILIHAEAFSLYRNVQRKSKFDDAIQFDPNRWNKKRLPKKVKTALIWGVIIILIILGMMNDAF